MYRYFIVILLFACTPISTATPTLTPTETPSATPTHTPTATLTPTPIPQFLAAFPSARGYGAQSIGGRGGAVFEVTNLNDAGVGSLRACMEATGKRTCVFRVSGTITLSKEIAVRSPYLTVAGQTSPGGITLRAKAGGTRPLIYLPAGADVHDVIIMYLRLRHGVSPVLDGKLAKINIFIGAGHDLVIDHNSMSWTGKDNLGIWWEVGNGSRDIYNITVSSNILSEGLWNHSTGLLTGADDEDWTHIQRVDIHHNAFIANSHRNPRINGIDIRVINNVVYNWRDRASEAARGGTFDIINNYWLAGPMSNGTLFIYQSSPCSGCTPDYPDPSVYIAGNVAPHSTDNPNTIYDHYKDVPGKREWYRSMPLPQPPIAVTVESAEEAYQSVMGDVGANKRLDCNGEWVSNVDSVDARVMLDVRNRTGWDDLPPASAGVYPVHEQLAPCVDTDRDGMPNQWEFQRGLNPNAASDRNGDADGNGYTNLEEYLQGV